jgi:hypothetical protein
MVKLKPGELNMYKYVVAALLVVLVPTTCLAAGPYYVARDTSIKGVKCKVVEEKPDGVKMLMVGTATYATRQEAKSAKKAAPECNPPETESKPESK